MVIMTDPKNEHFYVDLLMLAIHFEICECVMSLPLTVLYELIRTENKIFYDRQVAKQMEEEMEVWLKLGVDGFYIRGLGDFYMGDGNLQYGAMHGYLNGWQTLLNAHETYLGARVLMVEGSYMKKVERDQPSIVGPLLNFIHLIDEPLVLNTVNLTYSLQVEHFVDILVATILF